MKGMDRGGEGGRRACCVTPGLSYDQEGGRKRRAKRVNDKRDGCNTKQTTVPTVKVLHPVTIQVPAYFGAVVVQPSLKRRLPKDWIKRLLFLCPASHFWTTMAGCTSLAFKESTRYPVAWLTCLARHSWPMSAWYTKVWSGSTEMR